MQIIDQWMTVYVRIFSFSSCQKDERIRLFYEVVQASLGCYLRKFLSAPRLLIWTHFLMWSPRIRRTQHPSAERLFLNLDLDTPDPDKKTKCWIRPNSSSAGRFFLFFGQRLHQEEEVNGQPQEDISWASAGISPDPCGVVTASLSSRVNRWLACHVSWFRCTREEMSRPAQIKEEIVCRPFQGSLCRHPEEGEDCACCDPKNSGGLRKRNLSLSGSSQKEINKSWAPSHHQDYTCRRRL